MVDLEYNYIKKQVFTLTGIDLNCYKSPQMQRRLKTYLARSNCVNWAKFFRLLRADPAALSKFRDYLTINVSSFFRDAAKYNYLREAVLPALLQNRPNLRVWSAGCSRGQEIYSLAMLLTEANQAAQSHQLLATDIDQSALEWARAGGPYSTNDMVNVPPFLRSRYFRPENDTHWVNDTLRRQVIFRPHNLLKDPIIGRFDLIVCRNVVIYFQPEIKQTLYKRFYDALRPGGVLYVGGTEMIPKATELGFEAIHVSFYRRRKGISLPSTRSA